MGLQKQKKNNTTPKTEQARIKKKNGNSRVARALSIRPRPTKHVLGLTAPHPRASGKTVPSAERCIPVAAEGGRRRRGINDHHKKTRVISTVLLSKVTYVCSFLLFASSLSTVAAHAHAAGCISCIQRLRPLWPRRFHRHFVQLLAAAAGREIQQFC